MNKTGPNAANPAKAASKIRAAGCPRVSGQPSAAEASMNKDADIPKSSRAAAAHCKPSDAECSPSAPHIQKRSHSRPFHFFPPSPPDAPRHSRAAKASHAAVAKIAADCAIIIP